MQPYLRSLPIWRDASRLLLLVEEAVRHFPRYHKDALGADLRRQAMLVCRLIVRGGRHLRHARHYRLVAALRRRFPWLDEMFFWHGTTPHPRWRPVMVTSLRSQWRFFQRQWPAHLLLVQVGKRLEVFNQHVETVARLCGLARPGSPRQGFVATLSLPWRARDQVMRRLRRSGQPYGLISEEGYLRSGMKRRSLTILAISDQRSTINDQRLSRIEDRFLEDRWSGILRYEKFQRSRRLAKGGPFECRDFSGDERLP
jgi:hypothetical protein